MPAFEQHFQADDSRCVSRFVMREIAFNTNCESQFYLQDFERTILFSIENQYFIEYKSF
jgi:hypothetical protein